MSTATIEKPASDKQIAFLKNLIKDRDVDDHQVEYVMSHIEAGGVTHAFATTEIGSMLKKPYKSGQKPGQPNKEAEPGFYEDSEGNVFQVKKSRSSLRMYAMRMIVIEPKQSHWHGHTDPEDKKPTKVQWGFASGAMKNFQSWKPLTEERAAEFGQKTGTCMICGRLLTNGESIKLGIGPICREKVWG